MSAVRTTCPYCGVGCGIVATPDGRGSVAIAGDPDHPANFGRLCGKGAALGETLGLSGRLLHPEIRGRRVGWDEALGVVADGFRRTIDEHGPDSVAFYVSGQLLTEDYYVANKLLKGFIGSSALDTNSRLCMASSVAGHRRAFGADVVPGCYDDLEIADLVILVGSNLAWCHPILHQRLLRAKAARPGMAIVVVDPRRTASCDEADLHLAIGAGTDTILFNGLLASLAERGTLDVDYIGAHTEGFAAALDAARASAPDARRVARACGLSEADVETFYALFAATDRTVTVYSQGVNQSSAGTDKVNAIINCHLATGRIGRPGMGPFSVTGQPNAMGGREVGALANQLAAHLGYDNPAEPDLAARFWRSPGIARKEGPKAIEMFRRIEQGAIKAVWIMATNPAVSLPDASQVRRALARCPLVVVSDCMRGTDTVSLGHVLLPALAWGEKEGTVTNSERRLSRQRAFLPPPGEAQPDWWIVSEVARRLGHGAAFAYASPADILREHAALSAFENGGKRAFDIGGLAGLDDAAIAALEPVQWPIGPDRRGTGRLYADGAFATPSGRAQFVPIEPRRPAQVPVGSWPLVLNTGRERDHWHTMTRTGRSPRLSRHRTEPAIAVNPADAEQFGVADGGFGRVISARGAMLGRIHTTDDQKPGTIFVPMHWSGEFAGDGRVNEVVNPATDPTSGQPELKHTPVRLEPWQPRWQGILASRDRLDFSDIDYWAAAAAEHHMVFRLAGEQAPDAALPLLRSRVDDASLGLDWVRHADRGAGRYGLAAFRDSRLVAAIFIAADHSVPSADTIAPYFAAETVSPAERMALLAGQGGGIAADLGPIVCSCLGVGRNAILEAVRRGHSDVKAVGRATGAGTNCGTCVPEIRSLIGAAGRKVAA